MQVRLFPTRSHNQESDALVEQSGLRHPSGPAREIVGPYSVLTKSAPPVPTLAYTLKVVGAHSYLTLNFSQHKTRIEADVAYRLLGPGDHRGAILSDENLIHLVASRV